MKQNTLFCLVAVSLGSPHLAFMEQICMDCILLAAFFSWRGEECGFIYHYGLSSQVGDTCNLIEKPSLAPVYHGSVCGSPSVNTQSPMYAPGCCWGVDPAVQGGNNYSE